MALLTTILSLLAAIAPAIKDAGAIGSVISTLESVIAEATTEVQSVMPYIKNIIAMLRSNGHVTAAQMTQLQALDAAADSAFDAAVAGDPDLN